MNETVLIVDDSLTVRMHLAEEFGAAGFRTRLCATAREAREALRAEPIALVILDVVLPDGDGVDLLGEIRGDSGTCDLPILMLSTEADVKNRIRGLRTGADDYVGKPYDPGYVLARSRDLVRRRRKGAEGEDRVLVLVIDDSATSREELRPALERGGYAVVTASTGEEGLQLAASRRPGAIIVDGVMPGIDGVTVIRRIRLDAALRGTPCILLTGADDHLAELRALDAGADVFVRKDGDVDVILARLTAALRSAHTQRAEAESLVGPKRVLAVDDSLTYLHELADVLRGEGYDVVLAHSGEEAIAMVAVQPVDCILLDLMMPGIDGKETCRRLKASPAVRDIPIIMLTALEDREAMIAGLATGADDYISKSSEFAVLKARLHAQIRRKQFEDENRRVREELLRSQMKAAEEHAARRLAETRAELVGELERKNKELEAFSYSVSHDLRAPLRSITGYASVLIEDHGGSLDDAGRACLDKVRSSAQRMSELIDDLLLLSRVSLPEVRKTPVNLSALVETVVGELRAADPGRDVAVHIQPSLTIDADDRLLRVLLDNLLGNAWKFTSRTPHAEIEVGADVRGLRAVYFVRDNGAGFDMAYVGKLFRPFQRLHGEAEFPGTGVGLATVQRVAERHGGRAWAESELGRGTTLFFTLEPEQAEGA